MSLNEWIACEARDTALIVFVPAHPNVALVTPRFTPGVFSNVIILLECTIGQSVISDEKKRVV